MRGLQFSDVFKFSEILDKTGLEFDLNEMMNRAKGDTDIQAKIGGEIGLLLLKKIHKAEREIYKFIASLEEKNVDDIMKYSFKDLMNFFEGLVNQEDFASFFQKAGVDDER